MAQAAAAIFYYGAALTHFDSLLALGGTMDDNILLLPSISPLSCSPMGAGCNY